MRRSFAWVSAARIRVVSLAGKLLPGATGRWAARQFRTPAKRGRSAALARAQSVDGVLRETVHADGYRIATYRMGDRSRPLVLLVHGWNSYGLRFGAWIDRLLAAGYRVVAFDQPAHGLSSGEEASLVEFAQVLKSLLGTMGTPYAVIAHSLGATSLPFAIGTGRSPEKAVLIAPLSDPRAAAARMFSRFGLSAAAFAAFESALNQRGHGTFDDYRPERAVSAMGAAALFVHDRDDAVTPWEEGRAFANSWPGSRLLSTSGLGHYRLLDDEYVITQALEFLTGASPVPHVVPARGRIHDDAFVSSMGADK